KIEGVVQFRLPIIALRRSKARTIKVRSWDRHRPRQSRSISPPASRVSRRGRASCHTMPGLREGNDFVTSRIEFRELDCCLIGFAAGAEEQNLLERVRGEVCQRSGQVHYRLGQHPAKKVIELCHGLS